MVEKLKPHFEVEKYKTLKKDMQAWLAKVLVIKDSVEFVKRKEGKKRTVISNKGLYWVLIVEWIKGTHIRINKLLGSACRNHVDKVSNKSFLIHESGE